MQLTIHNLSMQYTKGPLALDGVELSIEMGLFGLLGPNGAGKTTLMRILATLLEPTDGAVSLDDIDVLRQKQSVRRMLGYLPQEFGLYPDVTAHEMLDHLAILKGLDDGAYRRDQVAKRLQQTNLWEQRNIRLGTFSGGMKRRFGIAQALIGNPKLLIVDEPTAGLDPSERRRFHNILAEIGEERVVILSTHIVDDIYRLCADMAILHRGQVVLTGSPGQLVKAMEGKVWSTEIRRQHLVSYAEQFQLLSSQLVGGKVQLRVYAEQQPDTEFELAVAELEDVYFHKLDLHASTVEAAAH